MPVSGDKDELKKDHQQSMRRSRTNDDQLRAAADISNLAPLSPCSGNGENQQGENVVSMQPEIQKFVQFAGMLRSKNYHSPYFF